SRRPPHFSTQAPGCTCDRPSFPTRRSSDLLAASPMSATYQKLGRNTRPCMSGGVLQSATDASPRASARPHALAPTRRQRRVFRRSEEHTSELQSLRHLVCRLLLEKKKTHTN